MHGSIVVSTGHVDAPWITADLAVLNEAAVDVRLDVDLHLLAAKRTRDHELVWHLRDPTAMRESNIYAHGVLIPHHRLAGGTIPFIRRYTTSCP
jgi:hypothetical protein